MAVAGFANRHQVFVDERERGVFFNALYVMDFSGNGSQLVVRLTNDAGFTQR
jgi:hypothetical protein